MKALAFGILATAIGFALDPLGIAKAQTAGAEGIDVVDVIRTTATVQKIDLDKRKVALLFDDGKKKTLKVDKSVRNLDQVKVGDHLKLTYAEDIAVLVGKTKETVGTEDVGLTSIVPRGSKPGGVMVETTSLTAKVLSVDSEHRRAVVEEPDGHKKTIKFGKKVTNLDQLQPGETVDVVMTEELVIDVTR